MRQRIFQFGDQISELFRFTPFEEEESYNDSVEIAKQELEQVDGSFRYRGYGQSRKPAQTITKRFQYYHEGIASHTDGRVTMTDMIDHLHETLRGGVKRLYMVTESGEIRYTYAEVVSIPYDISYTDSKQWHPFSIDFELADPHWYEVNDGLTYYIEGVPFETLVKICSPVLDLSTFTKYRIGYDLDKDFDVCSYDGIIYRDINNLLDCDPDDVCTADTCSETNQAFILGSEYLANGDTTFSVCRNKQSRLPLISFRGAFTNPKITNTTNGNYLQYTGTLSGYDYLRIDTNVLSGEPTDMTIDTTIGGFDAIDITINNNGFFELDRGTNEFLIEGGTSANSKFTIKLTNKY